MAPCLSEWARPFARIRDRRGKHLFDLPVDRRRSRHSESRETSPQSHAAFSRRRQRGRIGNEIAHVEASGRTVRRRIAREDDAKRLDAHEHRGGSDGRRAALESVTRYLKRVTPLNPPGSPLMPIEEFGVDRSRYPRAAPLQSSQ